MSSAVNEVPVLERESKLWSASKQYMLGEITLNQLEDVESRYALYLDISTLTAKRPTEYFNKLEKRSTFDRIKEFVSMVTNKIR